MWCCPCTETKQVGIQNDLLTLFLFLVSAQGIRNGIFKQESILKH